MNDEIVIREMKPDEKKVVTSIMKRAFPFLMRLFFSFTKHNLVATINGKIVGGVILKIFSISKESKSGLIAWIFTDPQYQGVGVGRRLSSSGIEFLEQSGCSEIFAMVEGFNTSSSKQFANRGFRKVTPFEQFALYGPKLFKLWFHQFHIFDVGHFVWVKTDRSITPRRSFQWITTLILQALLLAAAFFRIHGTLSLSYLLNAFLAVSLFYVVRSVTMLSVAKIKKLDVTYGMWESGMVLNTMVSLLFGGFVPAPGSFYPVKENWSYREVQSTLGTMAFVASLFHILLLYACHYFLTTELSPQINTMVNQGFQIGLTIAIVDILLPFFPFTSYNGRRVLEWNKGLWAVIALPVWVLFFL